MFQRKAAQVVSARNNTASHLPQKSTNENTTKISKSSLLETGKAAHMPSGKSALINASSAASENPSRKRRALTDLSNQVGGISAGTKAINNGRMGASALPLKLGGKAVAAAAEVKSKTATIPTTTTTTTTRRQSQQFKQQQQQKLKEEQKKAAAAIEATKRQKTVVAVPEVIWNDLDAEDFDDPMMVPDYVVEIFENMRDAEKRMMPDPHYMVKQKELRWKMRSVLVDWLVEVHQKFKLMPETLFLTINIIDRFLSLRSVPFVKLQLVGITAMFIAAKYEEVYAPSVSQYCYMADGGYQTEEVLKAERSMLTTLGFNLQYPNPLNFLRRVSKADGYDLHTRTIGKYLMEVTLLDECFLKYTPSMIAAASIYIARWVYSHCEWTGTLEHYAGYSESELKGCVADIINFLHKDPGFDSVKSKYSLEKHLYVACIVEQWLTQCVEERSFMMPWF